MKHKTAELTGALLDAAVAKADGWLADRDNPNVWHPPERKGAIPRIIGGTGCYKWAPSTYWSDAGAIIELERIGVFPVMSYPKGPPDFSNPNYGREDGWMAGYRPYAEGGSIEFDGVETRGATPLIAAMRAYVASKFGEEVDL